MALLRCSSRVSCDASASCSAQDQSLDSMLRFACGGADKALLAEREFMAVMHLIYVAHREQLPGSGPGSPASSAGSSMTSPRERNFTCVLQACGLSARRKMPAVHAVGFMRLRPTSCLSRSTRAQARSMSDVKGFAMRRGSPSPGPQAELIFCPAGRALAMQPRPLHGNTWASAAGWRRAG